MNKLFTIIILLFAGAVTIFYVNYALIKNAKETWLRQKEIVHIQATRTFETRIERYASIVSGLRSYMINKKDLPNALEMQNFLNNHVKDLNFEDSVIISYLDADHNFIYSISNNQIDPSSLVGTNVRDYRGESAIRNLEKVFEDDELHLFKPLNLIEGWVGISFNFSIREKGEVIGYVVAIVNFSSIIKNIYDPQITDEFCYRFMNAQGIDFDRERVYNQAKVYHDRKDPEYYKNFNTADLDFLYSETELFGQKFRIGTSYKKPFSHNLMIPVFSGAWFVIFSVMVIFILRQSQVMDLLNNKLILKNEQVKEQRDHIEEKNILLEEVNASKDRFFSIIGHDLKSPLKSIQSLISMRRDKIISAEETEKFLTDLDQVNAKSVNLLDNLLEWATINISKGKTNFQEISLLKIANETIQLLHGMTKLKSIKVVENFDENLEIVGDKNMISVIFRNVLSNAIKFSHENGAITFQVQSQDETVKIIISDNGVGMTKKKLDEVFKIDKKFSSIGTDGEMGTGLGLIISKEYVELHNGKIWAESEDSKGTTFYITLPKRQPS